MAGCNQTVETDLGDDGSIDLVNDERYDAAGLITSKFIRDTNNPEESIRIDYIYHPNGMWERIEYTDIAGQRSATENFDYTVGYRLTKWDVDSDADGIADRRVEYTVDNSFRVLRELSFSGIPLVFSRDIQYEYDSLGRIVAERSDLDFDQMFDSVLTFTWSPTRLLRTDTVLLGEWSNTTRYFYDELGRISSVEQDYAGDERPEEIARYKYDDAGRLVSYEIFRGHLEYRITIGYGASRVKWIRYEDIFASSVRLELFSYACEGTRPAASGRFVGQPDLRMIPRIPAMSDGIPRSPLARPTDG